MDSANKLIYFSNSGVHSYIETVLQPPEVNILVKYRDSFYGKNILDLGCGAGRTSFHLRNFSDNYIGVDYSEKMIEFCRREYPDLDFRLCDARDLSCFDSGQFDFIMFSYNGIDYVSHPDRIKILKEMKRVLKKGGVLVFSTHNRNYAHMELSPEFQFKLNLFKMPGIIKKYLLQRSNQKKLNHKQSDMDEFAIINESGNDFGLLTYYISRKSQTAQLNQIGFSVVDMFGQNGEALAVADDDSKSCWVYYVSTLND